MKYKMWQYFIRYVSLGIACHELESFYLGDIEALSKVLHKQIPKGKYTPDANPSPSEYIASYKKMPKTEMAKKMGNIISHDAKSKSFQQLRKAILHTLEIQNV